MQKQGGNIPNGAHGWWGDREKPPQHVVEYPTRCPLFRFQDSVRVPVHLLQSLQERSGVDQNGNPCPPYCFAPEVLDVLEKVPDPKHPSTLNSKHPNPTTKQAQSLDPAQNTVHRSLTRVAYR